MRVRSIGLVISIALLAATCEAEQPAAETPLQIPNPHYVVVSESIVVDAPVDRRSVRELQFDVH